MPSPYAPAITGTCTQSVPNRVSGPQSFVKQCIQLSWVSDGSGNVAFQTPLRFNGEITHIVTDPTNVNTSYNVTLKTQLGIDVLNGGGTARSKTANEFLAASSPRSVVDDQLWLEISNSSPGDIGNVWIYIKHN